MEERKKVCRHCGSEINPVNDKCPNCASTSFEYKLVSVVNPNGTVASAPPKKSKKGIAFAMVSLAVVLVIALIIIITSFSSKGGDKTFNVGDEIATDWFSMKVVEAKSMRGTFAYLPQVEEGCDRVLLEIVIRNNRADEDLDMHLNVDFYVETDTKTKIYSKNEGGDYNTYDKMGQYGLFYSMFMVSKGKSLRGFVAYDFPRSSKNLRFVYEEYNFKGDEKLDVKGHYNVKIPYSTPVVPSGYPADFERKALEHGYVLEILNDYDGYKTFWIGAERYSDDAAVKDAANQPDPAYTFDFTEDISEKNAMVEYNLYVDQVKNIGGIVEKGQGTGYQYQINRSSTKFGISYRVGRINLFVVADIKYRDEILAFFDALNYTIDSEHKTKT